MLAFQLVNDNRLLCQARVTLKGVFHLFLRWGILLPGLNVHLKHFGPRAIEVNLFARAFVDDFKAVSL
jgi:hypothetical protein